MPRARTAPLEEIPDLPRVPWSQVRDSFITAWGYPGGQFEPEHLEILGPSGSGKTYCEATILRERVRRRGSAVIFIATKRADKTIGLLGWPIVDDWRDVVKYKQVIYWPRTELQGEQWEAYMAHKIEDLLDRLWKAKAKVIVVFDEIATSEELSRRLRIIIKRYWREARSVGITLVAMKQRPQGVQRDMHSETAWICAFKPKDEEDGIRVAQVMGSRKIWLPILFGLDRDAREFVLLHCRTGDAVITWIDTPLKPATPERGGVYRKAA
jgi:nucleoside-triphosphatase THEP1